MHRSITTPFTLALALVACGPGDETSETQGATGGDSDGEEALTYWRDAESILREKCTKCHVDGGIAPFSLETYDQVKTFGPVLANAIMSGEMPPWPPDPSCAEYTHARALSEAQEETLLEFLAGDMPEGDPADRAPDLAPEMELVPDQVLEMPEAYTPPTAVEDDYRCFLIPWPAELTEPRYVTGLEVYPGERRIVHHVIVYAVASAQVQGYVDRDDAEPGPGYTCFGGPGPSDGSARWIGAWVPGMVPFFAPEGVGQQIDPGTTLVMQVHYHPIGMELPDRSSIALELASSVERLGEVAPLADVAWIFGGGAMTIPAGDADVTHEVTITRDHPILQNVLNTRLGLGPDDPVEVINAGMHMHLFGTRGRVEIRDPAGGAPTCLVDIPRWDFNWQSYYEFAEPKRLAPGQEINVQCWWDNSAQNQPFVGGQQLEPVTRDWGDGTLDEMCLGILYLTSVG
ncbi:MAG: hypothetical protein R3B09_09110 [Nannocystaceae bacterium]